MTETDTRGDWDSIACHDYAPLTPLAWTPIVEQTEGWHPHILVEHLAAIGVANEKSARIDTLATALTDGTINRDTAGKEIRRRLHTRQACADAAFAACAALMGWAPSEIHATLTDDVNGPEITSELLWEWAGICGKDPQAIAPIEDEISYQDGS